MAGACLAFSGNRDEVSWGRIRRVAEDEVRGQEGGRVRKIKKGLVRSCKEFRFLFSTKWKRKEL